MNIYKFGLNNWKQAQTTKEEEAYFNAWLKIRDWVKHNTNVEFEEPIEIELPHNTYHWTLFGVTPNNEAYIKRGSHGGTCDNYVDWPDGEYGSHSCYGTLDTENEPERLSSITMGMIKEAVDEWPNLKNQLKQRLAKLDSLFSFEA